jgi:HlyD family secretion protein
VDVDIITGSRSGVLRIRRGALGQSPSEDVFVQRGDRLVRRRVRYGFIGSEALEIAEGVTEGDQVVISDMTDYEGVKELRLK